MHVKDDQAQLIGENIILGVSRRVLPDELAV